MRYTDQEINDFKNRTNQELMIQNPQPVLDDLGIEYKEIGNDSFKMNLRGEKTPSAFISLKNGLWKYKDFGNGHNGSIVNVVMDATQKDFKSSLNYALQKLGVKNYLDEALESKSQNCELYQANRDRIKKQREANKQKERSHAVSKVTGTYDISTNQLAVDYLRARGIIKIPPNFKVISGEYENNQGDLKKLFGVGVLTQNGGADIHFLKKIGDLKTFQIGEKDISFFKNQNSKKVAVFESKLDYAAAHQQMNLSKVNIIIANSTSNAQKVAGVLKENDFEIPPMIFNQNDLAGYKFVANIAESAELEAVKSINYNVMSEYSKDINDLLLDNQKIADRIEIRDTDYFKSIADNLESIKKMQQTPVVTIQDLKIANNVTQSHGMEKER